MSDPYKGEQPPPAYTPSPQGYGAQPTPGSYQTGHGYQGYQSGAPPGYQQVPNAPAGYITAQPVRVTSTNVVVVGGCPACRVGILEDDFTLLGVCCAILFFPIGILCCLAMRERRCPNCGAVFG